MKNLLYASLVVVVALHSVVLSQTARQESLVINGQVLDNRGRPVPGAVASAHPDAGLRGKLPSATSDSRGNFTIAVSRSGSYAVTASKLEDGYPSSFNPFYYPSEESLARVLVEANQAAPLALVRLGPKAGKITGRLVDAQTGWAIEGRVQITLCRADVPKYCHRVTAGSQFNILVPPEPFTIQISAPGYQDWYESEGVDQQPTPVRVASDTTRALSISLERSPAHSKDVVDPSLLRAPEPLLPVADAEFDHYPRTTKLEWSAVAGAASYTVELEVCQPGGADRKECEQGALLQIRGNPPLSGVEGTSYEFLFIGAQPGRWRVWAVDTKGRAGAKSAWSKFLYRR